MRSVIFGIATFLLLVNALAAQPTSTGKIILDHADTLRSRSGVRELIGNVKIRRGVTRISADKARHYTSTGRVILDGAVRLIEPDRTLNALHIDYDERTGDFEARGEVDMTVGDSIRIRCNMSRYTELERKLDLFGNVIIDDLKEGARITGERGWWLEAEDEAVVLGDPVYRAPDEEADPPDTLVIESLRLTFFRGLNKAIFEGDVRLHQGDLRGIADTLTHNPDSSFTILTGTPKVWKDGDELSGDRIDIYYEGRQVDRTVVTGNAMAVSQTFENDVRRNRMTGEQLMISAVSDSVRLVRIEGKARGWYHVWDEEDIYQGVNQSAADIIELKIVSNKATDIKLLGRANGTFYPPEYVPAENPVFR